jgi:beta-barrel assembly-enhancing protease
VKIEWEGVYFDGRTAQPRRATVRPVIDGLRITLDDGTALSWPYSDVRQIQGVFRGQQVRLERSTTPETLVISDSEFLTALTHSASRAGRRFRLPIRTSQWLLYTVLAGGAAILVSAVLYLWGIPAFADRVAARVPPQWEEQLGETAVQEFTQHMRRCDSPQLTTALTEITTTLTTSWTPSPYIFHVTAVDVPVINALAAPGGYIIVFRGLIAKTRAPEELAGVLAHEMQHVLHRDATRGLVREMSVSALLNVATGGAGMTPLQAAGLLARLRYSREAETAADRDGVKMMEAAHLDLQGMIRMYQTLKREGGQAPRALAYLSAHPDIDSRIAELERLARDATYTPVPILPNVRWEIIAHTCST